MPDAKEIGKKLTIEDVVKSMAAAAGIPESCIDMSRLGIEPTREVSVARELNNEELVTFTVDRRSRAVTLANGCYGIVRLSTFKRGKTREPTERWMLPYYLALGRTQPEKRKHLPETKPIGALPQREFREQTTENLRP